MEGGFGGWEGEEYGGPTGETTIDYTYPANGVRPHAVTARSNGDVFSYDANGNMTGRTQEGVTWTQVFDAENRLVSVSDGTTTTTYVYDGSGGRLKRTVDDGTTVTTTLYVAGMEIEKTNGTESKRTVYYPSGGAFRVIGGENAGLYFRHSDHLGSTSVLSNANGTKVAGSDVVYAPFGEVRSGEQSGLTDFGYTGQRKDDSTGGLMYYGARYYLPGIQHFVSADTVVPGPANPQAFNRYSYAFNNPIRMIDPSGHAPVPPGAGASVVCQSQPWLCGGPQPTRQAPSTASVVCQSQSWLCGGAKPSVPQSSRKSILDPQPSFNGNGSSPNGDSSNGIDSVVSFPGSDLPFADGTSDLGGVFEFGTNMLNDLAGMNYNNITTAWDILWHPNSRPEHRLLAYVYLGTGWGTAAVLLAAGTFLFAAGAIEAVAGAGTVAEAACADGDCGNEARGATSVIGHTRDGFVQFAEQNGSNRYYDPTAASRATDVLQNIRFADQVAAHWEPVMIAPPAPGVEQVVIPGSRLAAEIVTFDASYGYSLVTGQGPINCLLPLCFFH